jgi:hypothetical protein
MATTQVHEPPQKGKPAVHTEPDPTLPIPKVQGPRAHAHDVTDPKHAAAIKQVADAASKVINDEVESFRTLIAQMAAAGKMGDENARDNLARQANDHIVNISAVAESSKEYLTSNGEKNTLADIRKTLNREYAHAITEAGFDHVAYVNIEPAKPVLSGAVKQAFDQSLDIYQHTYLESAAHMRSIFAAMDQAAEKRYSDLLQASNVDEAYVFSRLAMMKHLAREGSPVMAPVGDAGASPTTTDSNIAIAPVSPVTGAAADTTKTPATAPDADITMTKEEYLADAKELMKRAEKASLEVNGRLFESAARSFLGAGEDKKAGKAFEKAAIAQGYPWKRGAEHTEAQEHIANLLEEAGDAYSAGGSRRNAKRAYEKAAKFSYELHIGPVNAYLEAKIGDTELTHRKAGKRYAKAAQMTDGNDKADLLEKAGSEYEQARGPSNKTARYYYEEAQKSAEDPALIETIKEGIARTSKTYYKIKNKREFSIPHSSSASPSSSNSSSSKSSLSSSSSNSSSSVLSFAMFIYQHNYVPSNLLLDNYLNMPYFWFLRFYKAIYY